jgi:hypothetical protein
MTMTIFRFSDIITFALVPLQKKERKKKKRKKKRRRRSKLIDKIILIFDTPRRVPWNE